MKSNRWGLLPLFPVIDGFNQMGKETVGLITVQNTVIYCQCDIAFGPDLDTVLAINLNNG